MSFLLGDEYASSGSSSGSDSDADERLRASLDASDGGVADGGDAQGPVTALPSAERALESAAAAAASFRAPRPSAGAATAVKAFDLLQEEEETQRQQQRDGQRRAVRKAQQQTQQQTQQQQRKRPRAASPEPPGVGRSDRDPRAAKERVKQQRAKGQAGIGSDFRAWKSETEMALRQQFD